MSSFLMRKRAGELKPKEIHESLARADIRIEFPALPPPPGGQSSSGGESGGSHEGAASKTPGVRLYDLIKAGLIDPPFRLQRTYKGQELHAEIRPDGTVRFDGKSYSSPSTAGQAARKSVDGKGHSTNGWTFWQFQGAHDGKPIPLDALRQEYLRRR